MAVLQVLSYEFQAGEKYISYLVIDRNSTMTEQLERWTVLRGCRVEQHRWIKSKFDLGIQNRIGLDPFSSYTNLNSLKLHYQYFFFILYCRALTSVTKKERLFWIYSIHVLKHILAEQKAFSFSEFCFAQTSKSILIGTSNYNYILLLKLMNFFLQWTINKTICINMKFVLRYFKGNLKLSCKFLCNKNSKEKNMSNKYQEFCTQKIFTGPDVQTVLCELSFVIL